jgi:hypothetical protein
MDKGLRVLRQNGYSFDIEKEGVLFTVSQLTPEFLNPDTRDSAVHKYYFLKMNNQPH